jgi:acetyl esterase/lipase
VWPGDPQADGLPRPWIWYAHGGAWFFGQPQLPNAWVVPGLRSRRYHVVAIVYRKCPQVCLTDIVDDSFVNLDWRGMHRPRLLLELLLSLLTDKRTIAD